MRIQTGLDMYRVRIHARLGRVRKLFPSGAAPPAGAPPTITPGYGVQVSQREEIRCDTPPRSMRT